jgi:methionyl-tRNA formyltransferase
VSRLLFVGSKRLGLRVLREISGLAPRDLVAVATLDDTGDGRGAFGDFQRFTSSAGIPLHVVAKPSALASVVAAESPDLCIVVGWYAMVPPAVLQAPRFGWVGVHASLLPKYRGGAPLVWALINGERESGVSLFHFDDGMDSGDIVGQKRFAIGDDETIADVTSRAEMASVELIAEHYPQLRCGQAPRSGQRHSDASYGGMRRPSDGRIHWASSARDVHNFVRAQTRPYPGAFSLKDDRDMVRIWRTTLFPHAVYGIPGQVVLVDDRGSVVACGGSTAVRLESVEFADAVERPRLTVGDRLR